MNKKAPVSKSWMTDKQQRQLRDFLIKNSPNNVSRFTLEEMVSNLKAELGWSVSAPTECLWMKRFLIKPHGKPLQKKAVQTSSHHVKELIARIEALEKAVFHDVARSTAAPQELPMMDVAG